MERNPGEIDCRNLDLGIPTSSNVSTWMCEAALCLGNPKQPNDKHQGDAISSLRTCEETLFRREVTSQQKTYIFLANKGRQKFSFPGFLGEFSKSVWRLK